MVARLVPISICSFRCFFFIIIIIYLGGGGGGGGGFWRKMGGGGGKMGLGLWQIIWIWGGGTEKKLGKKGAG